MSVGYIQKRRGILDHLRDGRLTLLELGAHDVIILLADKSTGLWTGSAKALAANCGAGDITDRQARHLLESLENKGYIRRFPKRRSHANYPILVNRYLVTFGAYSGMTLNASATSDWRKPVYERRQEQGAEDGAQQGAGRAPYQEVRIEKEKKTKPAPKPAAPADPRFQPFLDFAFGAFEHKHGQKPTWSGKDFRALSTMLASNKGLGADELQRRFRNYIGSTETFTQKQGDSLAYFCAHTDSFLAGPMLAVQGKGAFNGNAKPSANDAAASFVQHFSEPKQ